MTTILSNEEVYIEMMDISRKMNELYKENRLSERNELVPKWRELYRIYDFGFSIKEKVQTIAWRRTTWNEEAIIIEHTKDNYFLIRNEKGWVVYVPGFQIRKIKEQEPEPMQLTLF